MRHKTFLRPMKYTDQHGRPYVATIDVRTALPIDVLLPQFGAPLMPRAHLIRLNADALGKAVIDYDKWEREIDIQEDTWTQKLAEVAKSQYGDKAGEMMADPSSSMLAVVGPRPTSKKLVQAARAGNRWVLGLPKESGEPYDPEYVPSWAKDVYTPPKPASEQFFIDDEEPEVQQFVDEEVPGVKEIGPQPTTRKK